ncbi:MAG: translation elongation factor Ts [Candidatus Pelagibacter sp.]|nr:translation elongation factor Ts [Candidatus Pelagibacter sp.]OUV97551.1 MAG: translation elongation factor Ts [Candidatus Pelagibacter sp. TMED142]
MSTLEKVKELREITGAGMQDCKTALNENNNDIEKAVDFLRKKGILKAAKKSARDTAEGIVTISVSNKKAVILEVNSETDFVAKNKEFIKFCEDVTNNSINANTLDDITKTKLSNNETVEENLTKLISKIGENIKIRRFEKIITDDYISSYIHNKVSENSGKIGVLISYNTSDNNISKELAKNICMHIAALNPMVINKKDIDEKFVDKEKKIILEQLKDDKKNPNILEKIVNGKLSKVISENSLMEQKWVLDPDLSVKSAITNYAKDKNIKFEINKFLRIRVGEGIVLSKSDFKEEVQNLAK